MGAVLWGLAFLVLAVALVPLGYYALRVVGRSRQWRRIPGLRPVVRLAAMEQYPAVDRSGRLVAFEALPEHRHDIHVLDRTTGQDRVVSAGGLECRMPAMAGDGSAVAWVRTDARMPCRRSVAVVRPLDPGRQRTGHAAAPHDPGEVAEARVCAPLDFVTACVLDGSGRRLAAAGARDGLRKVAVFDAPWGEGRLALEGRSEERCPALSDDGRFLAFLTTAGRHPGRTFEPALLDLASGEATRVEVPGDARTVSISADGRRLAFEVATGTGCEIAVADLASGRLARLGPGHAPVLDPGGASVVFDRIADGVDLVRVDLATGRRSVLLACDPYPHRPVFADGGRKLFLQAGVFNTLAKTGDTDLFLLDLAPGGTAGRADAEAPGGAGDVPPAWEPARLAGVPRCDTPPAAWTCPRASMWVASWYHRPDGSRAPLAEQDDQPLPAFSQRLAAMVSRVRALTGAPAVNVVCHCVGGLVAKGALQYWHDGRKGFEGPDGVPTHDAVRRLVTLASPLRGNSLGGVLPLMRAIRFPYFRFGFRRHSWDMVRGSEFMRRLNLGVQWRNRRLAAAGGCYKPRGPTEPPFHASFTSNSYIVFDGAVEIGASRCGGVPGDPRLAGCDEFGLMAETPDGRHTFGPGRKLVHVPEDLARDFVVEDKCRAVADYIRTRFEPDLPILFVHGSYLMRGMSELSWLVMMARLSGDTGEVPEGQPRWDRMDASPTGEEPFWLLDAGWGE